LKHESRSVFAILFCVLTISAINVHYSASNSISAKYATRNVFVVVMDGVRYSETLGDPSHQLIPHIWNDLKPLGTMYTNFRNDFITVTVPGHASILTGVWQNIKNDGTERPHKPTIFEYYRKQTGSPMNKTWVVVQHWNLLRIDFSDDPQYGEPYGASIDSPSLHNPSETEDIDDFATWEMLRTVMRRDHPLLAIVNFGMTDIMGHLGNWSAYQNAVRDADQLIYSLFLEIQSDPVYEGKTSIIITNDHGRHLDDVKTGFQDHGDHCEGCTHVMMLAIGPDIKVNSVVNVSRRLIDIAPTIGALMSFDTPMAKGEVMTEMLVEEDKQTDQTGFSWTIILTAAVIIVGGFSCVIVLRKISRK